MSLCTFSYIFGAKHLNLCRLGSAPGRVRPCECWCASCASSAIADMLAPMRQRKPIQLADEPAAGGDEGHRKVVVTRLFSGGVHAPAGISLGSGRPGVQTMVELLAPLTSAEAKSPTAPMLQQAGLPTSGSCPVPYFRCASYLSKAGRGSRTKREGFMKRLVPSVPRPRSSESGEMSCLTSPLLRAHTHTQTHVHRFLCMCL